jgi:hypothetical protein
LVACDLRLVGDQLGLGLQLGIGRTRLDRIELGVEVVQDLLVKSIVAALARGPSSPERLPFR